MATRHAGDAVDRYGHAARAAPHEGLAVLRWPWRRGPGAPHLRPGLPRRLWGTHGDRRRRRRRARGAPGPARAHTCPRPGPGVCDTAARMAARRRAASRPIVVPPRGHSHICATRGRRVPHAPPHAAPPAPHRPCPIAAGAPRRPGGGPPSAERRAIGQAQQDGQAAGGRWRRRRRRHRRFGAALPRAGERWPSRAAGRPTCRAAAPRSRARGTAGPPAGAPLRCGRRLAVDRPRRRPGPRRCRPRTPSSGGMDRGIVRAPFGEPLRRRQRCRRRARPRCAPGPAHQAPARSAAPASSPRDSGASAGGAAGVSRVGDAALDAPAGAR